jgi:hypothetical protein
MKLFGKLLSTTGVILLLSQPMLLASEKSASSVMKNAYTYLGAIPQYAFDVVIVKNEIDALGTNIAQYKDKVQVKVSRPESLRVDIKGNSRDRSNYLHKGIYTMVDHIFGFYGEINTSKPIDGSLDYILNHFGVNPPLTALIYSDMEKRMHFKKAKYFGLKDVAGVECDYIAFKKNKKIVHVWIATGDKPLVQAYSIIDTTSKERPRMNTTVRWKLDAKIDESDFIFTPSKDVTKISVESAN